MQYTSHLFGITVPDMNHSESLTREQAAELREADLMAPDASTHLLRSGDDERTAARAAGLFGDWYGICMRLRAIYVLGCVSAYHSHS